MKIEILKEVWTTPKKNSAQLGLRWYRYSFKDGDQCGYRFIWRSERGLHADRLQAYIPSAAVMFELMQKASKASWFGVVERQGPPA